MRLPNTVSRNICRHTPRHSQVGAVHVGRRVWLDAAVAMQTRCSPPHTQTHTHALSNSPTLLSRVSFSHLSSYMITCCLVMRLPNTVSRNICRHTPPQSTLPAPFCACCLGGCAVLAGVLAQYWCKKRFFVDTCLMPPQSNSCFSRSITSFVHWIVLHGRQQQPAIIEVPMSSLRW